MALFGVIGLGQLGSAVATSLAKHGGEVIAIDSDAARVEAIKDDVTRALCMDATEEKTLRAAGVADCDTVVLALGEHQLEEAVLAVMILRDLGVGRIISRAGSDVRAKVLEKVGVSRVVFPERQIGMAIARQILTPALHEMVPISAGHSLVEIDVSADMQGRTLAQLHLRRAHGLNVVAIRRRREVARDDGSVEVREELDSAPGPESKLTSGDILVVVGADERIRAFGER